MPLLTLVCSPCPSVPPDSSFHFLASDFPPGSLKSPCLLLFPLLSSFPWFHYLSPFLAPILSLSPSSLSLCSAILQHPSLSPFIFLGSLLQGSPFCSPLPPSTSPSPLLFLLWLPLETGSPASSAPLLSPNISSCSSGAGTDATRDLYGATTSGWLAGGLPPCRSNHCWLEALAHAFHLRAAPGNRCRSQQAQSSAGSSPTARGLFIMKTVLLD